MTTPPNLESSALPPPIDVLQNDSVKILTIDIGAYEVESNVTLNVDAVESDGTTKPVVATKVFCITKEEVAGYLASKVWYCKRNRTLKALYYISSTLPRLMKVSDDDKSTYVIMFPLNEDNVDLLYDASLPVLIDQLEDENGFMQCIFMMDSKTYGYFASPTL